MRSQLARGVGYALLSLAAVVTQPGSAAAQSPSRLYLGVDRSHVFDLSDRASKVAVANPGIADVQVISPTQLLVIGKAPGVTSLVIFSSKPPLQLDLVVHPSPVTSISGPTLKEPPHAVLVQRGASMTEQLFTRDQDQRWLELGHVKPETAEPGKK